MNLDILNTVVGLTSLVLGILAVIVSLVLFRMSEASAGRMRESERLIQQHVKELDRVFNLLYADTWSLVRDSYTSMHRQLSTHPPAVAEPPGLGQASAPPVSQDPVNDDGSSELQEFLLAAHARAKALGDVSAEDLVSAAGSAGYGATEALGALYDLTFVQRRLFIGGSEIRPATVLYSSADEAQAAQRSMERRALEELTVSPENEEE